MFLHMLVFHKLFCAFSRCGQGVEPFPISEGRQRGAALVRAGALLLSVVLCGRA